MILSRFLALIYPRKCVFCTAFLGKEETDICSKCRKTLPYCEKKVHHASYSKRTVAVLFYEEDVREAILRYKFCARSSYRAAFGRLLAMKVAREAVEYDLITHVPVSRKRLRQRGYDQARDLAKATAHELGGKCTRLLRKVRNNPAQSSLRAPEQRRANVLGVYCATAPALVQGKRILLIDDVMTTGATLSECCKTLLNAGAAEVSCAVLATRRDKKQQVSK